VPRAPQEDERQAELVDMIRTQMLLEKFRPCLKRAIALEKLLPILTLNAS
jgi:hypothetical protein